MAFPTNLYTTMGQQPTLNDLLKGNTPVPEGGSGQISGQSYAFNNLAKEVAGTGAGATATASKELMSLLANPAAHPAYAQSLQGVLAAMRPQVEQGYQDLSDAFRDAGAMQSGAYAGALGKYAGEVNRNETIAASDVLSRLLPTLVQGYAGQAGQAPSLLDALKLNKSASISGSGEPSNTVAGLSWGQSSGKSGVDPYLKNDLLKAMRLNW